MLTRPTTPIPELATAPKTLNFVQDGLSGGHRAVMVFLAGLEGGGPRAVGSMIAVLDDGVSAGSFSSGCVEEAIVAEARDVLLEGRPRSVRFGKGSRYVDIRLPCGAAMELLFVPDPAAAAIAAATELLGNRQPVNLTIASDGQIRCDLELSKNGNIQFSTRVAPDLRLIVAGQGAEATALTHLARSFGALVELLSPDEQAVCTATRSGVSATLLHSVTTPPPLAVDPWTAIAVLFHDHEWEPALLEIALRSPAYWIGAMGSERTAEQRRAVLRDRGLDASLIDRVRGPIGMIRGARDPATLALSALAEVVGAFPGGTV